MNDNRALRIHIHENIHRIELIENFLKTNTSADEKVCKENIEVLTKVNKALQEIQQYREIGTVDEIKEILQIVSVGQDDVDESGISIGLLYTLLEYAEYKKIGTIEECRRAKELTS